MSEPNVIIVPETDRFVEHVSHENRVWTNKNLGEPQIERKQARFLLPYWLSQDSARRLYHILSAELDGDAYEFELGNSFVLPEPLSELKQRRTFSYMKLSEFGMVEVRPGLLIDLPR